MTTIEVTVTGARAMAVVVDGPLTAGMVGVPVKFSFDDSWAGLKKTAVFRAGKVTKDVLDIADTAIVPWEVMQKCCTTLFIGVLGTNEEGIQIPTVWANVDEIKSGADPSGDESTDPTLPVWQQLLQLLQLLKLQCVRSVNGAAPDENGNVSTNIVCVRFTRSDAVINNSVVNGVYFCDKSSAEIKKLLGAGFAVLGTICHNDGGSYDLYRWETRAFAYEVDNDYIVFADVYEPTKCFTGPDKDIEAECWVYC